MTPVSGAVNRPVSRKSLPDLNAPSRRSSRSVGRIGALTVYHTRTSTLVRESIRSWLPGAPSPPQAVAVNRTRPRSRSMRRSPPCWAKAVPATNERHADRETENEQGVAGRLPPHAAGLVSVRAHLDLPSQMTRMTKVLDGGAPRTKVASRLLRNLGGSARSVAYAPPSVPSAEPHPTLGRVDALVKPGSAVLSHSFCFPMTPPPPPNLFPPLVSLLLSPPQGIHLLPLPSSPPSSLPFSSSPSFPGPPFPLSPPHISHFRPVPRFLPSPLDGWGGPGGVSCPSVSSPFPSRPLPARVGEGRSAAVDTGWRRGHIAHKFLFYYLMRRRYLGSPTRSSRDLTGSSDERGGYFYSDLGPPSRARSIASDATRACPRPLRRHRAAPRRT